MKPLNFYLELSDALINNRETYMLFSVETVGEEYASQQVYVSDAKKDKNGYYVFKCKVPAKNMTTPIHAQMISGDNESPIYTYSVRRYADYLIEHEHQSKDYQNAKPLVIAMLHYGAAAQRYFNYPEPYYADDGVNEGTEWVDVEATNLESYAMGTADLPTGTTFEGLTLSLKSETTLSFYFISDVELTFSCDGMMVETDTSGDYQIARIRGIPSARLNDTFTVNVSVNGESSFTISASPMTYCYNVLNGTYKVTLQDIAKTLYRYSKEADIYFQN